MGLKIPSFDFKNGNNEEEAYLKILGVQIDVEQVVAQVRFCIYKNKDVRDAVGQMPMIMDSIDIKDSNFLDFIATESNAIKSSYPYVKSMFENAIDTI